MTAAVDVATLLARLTEAHAQLLDKGVDEPAALASDGDGTLWRGDIGEALFEAALRDRVLRPAALPALRREAAEHGLATTHDVHELAQLLFEAYQQRRYPEERVFAMMAWMFAGFPESELLAYCDRVLDDFGFEQAVHAPMRAVLAWARRQSMPVWLVSASPHLMVHCAARRLGLETAQVVAMQSASEAGVVQPRLANEATYAEGKVRRLRAQTAAPLLAAFGDSAFDAALLEQAMVPVAVGRAPALLSRLAKLPGAMVLDPDGGPGD